MAGSFSPLAQQRTPYKTGPSRGRPVHGLCVHMPGRTIIQRAVTAGRNPLEETISAYRRGLEGPTYVLGYKGLPDLVQIADERTVTAHVKSSHRVAYKSGWAGTPVHTLWRMTWDRWHKANPTDLYPGDSPNRAYVGIEVLPLLKPGPTGLWHTEAQHDAVAALFADLGARHGFGFVHGRLVGHEDVNPLDREDSGGGWDPGALRIHPRWDWHRVMKQVGGER